MKAADKVVYTSQDYYSGCMHKRNRHLVDNSSRCICFLNEKTGGTFYTVNYASEHIYSELESFIDLHTDYYLSVKVERQESPVEILAERRERMRRQYGWKYTGAAELPAQEA